MTEVGDTAEIATDWHAQSVDVAARWLAGSPDAVDRARQLAEHAQHAGHAAEVIESLLDCLGAALGTTHAVNRARQRLDRRAGQAADAALKIAVDAGNYRHRQGQ